MYTSLSLDIQRWRFPEVEVAYLVANLWVYIYLSEYSYLLRGTHIHFELAVATRVSYAKLSSAYAKLETCDASRTWFSATSTDCHGGYIESWRTRIRFGGKFDSQNFDVTARFRENPARLEFHVKIANRISGFTSPPKILLKKVITATIKKNRSLYWCCVYQQN